MKFCVSNIGKRGVVNRILKNEANRHIEARGRILAQGKSQESASHHSPAAPPPQEGQAEINMAPLPHNSVQGTARAL